MDERVQHFNDLGKLILSEPDNFVFETVHYGGQTLQRRSIVFLQEIHADTEPILGDEDTPPCLFPSHHIREDCQSSNPQLMVLVFLVNFKEKASERFTIDCSSLGDLLQTG